MISGISITCFAASYAVALALELSRLIFRSGIRGAIMIAFGAAGIVAQTLFMGFRAASGTITSCDVYLVAAWVLAAGYVWLTCGRPRTPVGLFVLPLVLALVGVAALHLREPSMTLDRASRLWGLVHGIFWLLGLIAVLAGFVAGLMYLIQDYRLKRHRPAWKRFDLPNLESLERANSRAVWLSVVCLTAGFLASIALNLVNHQRKVDPLSWLDPVVWSSGLVVAWMITAGLFSMLYRPARQGRKVAYLTVSSFILMALMLGVRLLLPTEHGAAPPSSTRLGSRSRPMGVVLERPALRAAHAPALRRPLTEESA
jgi:ABC-type uncharacterized transport system permease subunit